MLFFPNSNSFLLQKLCNNTAIVLAKGHANRILHSKWEMELGYWKLFQI